MKRHTLAAGAVLLALVLGGCAGGSPGEGTPAAEIDRDAVLRVGYPQVPVNLDPAQSPTFSNTSPYLEALYDRLLQLSADGEVLPMLATDWEFIDDGKTFRLVLRDDVTFDDGSPFDAEVVKANLERYLSETTTPVVRDTLNSVAGIEVVGEHEVEIALKPGLGADLPVQLADTAGYMVSLAGLADPDLSLKPAGTGPYELVELVPDVSLKLQRKADTHWSGEDVANFAEIIVEGVTDEATLINAFQTGTYDIVRVNASGRTAQIAASGTSIVHDIANAGYIHVMFNPVRVPEFRDPRVRQAVQYALDKEAIAGVTLEGSCHPTPSLLTPGRPGFVAALEDRYPYDPERARELLAEAGVDGMTLTGVFAAQSPLSDVTEAVQAMLGEIGLNVAFQSTAPATATTAWLDGTADLRVSGASTVADPGNALVRGASGPVMMTMQSDRVDELAVGVMDPSKSAEERTRQIEAVNEAIVEDVLSAVICHRKYAILAVGNLVGVPEIPALSRGGISFRTLGMTE